MEQQVLLEAIALRNAVRAGRYSRKEIQAAARKTYTAGHWTATQIATLVGYTAPGMRRVLRAAQEPQERPTGGTLAPECLDLALALYGAETLEHRRNLIDACILTGTSTRLIASMTQRPLSTIIYRKARLQKETPHEEDR